MNLNEVPEYDAILVGSPNHFGGPTRGIKKFISNLRALNLKVKKVAVFDTYMGEDFRKAVKKLEKQISEKVPDLKIVDTGFSVRVQSMKGPIRKEELANYEDYWNKIVNSISD